MEAALAAARVGDQIEHSNAMLGFLIGAAVGLAVGVALLGAVVAAPFTGGLSLCAGVAAVAALGGIVAGVGAGAMAGGILGGLMSVPSGPIITGSLNVFVNGIPAARGVLDVAACIKHGQVPKRIAQGSKTVGINSLPAARKGDKTECDGTIAAGSPNVFIGAEPGTFLPISPEIPEWMSSTAKWMMIIGGAVALGAGLFGAALGGLAAVGAFVGNVALGVVSSVAGKMIGGSIGEALWGEKGRIAGETIGELAGVPGARNAIRGLRGHPVDVATGELIVEYTDFELPGPLPLTWTRRWNSASGIDGDLGSGWSHSFDMALEILPREGLVKARLEDGRLTYFPLARPGEPMVNLSERLILHAEDDGYRIASYDGLSHVFRRFADDLHRLTAVRDAAGNQIRIERDADGKILAMIDVGGRRLGVTSDAAGRIIEIDAPHPTVGGARQRLVSYAYGPEGDLVQVVDARGTPAAYRYLAHLIVEEQRRGGFCFYFRWDDVALGRRARCIETWGDGDLYHCRFDYRPDDHVTVVTDDQGAETLYTYNRIGLVVLERDPLGHEQHWLWSEAGALLAYQDGAGRTSTFAYDQLNRLVRQTAPDGGSTVAGFEDLLDVASLSSPSLGLPIFATDPTGGVTRYAYDQRAQLISASDPLGRDTWFLRDERGLPLAIRDGEGIFRRYGWDEQGLLAWESDGQNHRRDLRHDALGRPRSVTVGGETTHYERDANGNILKITRARDGAQVRLDYDAEDHVIRHVDPLGRETHWDYAGLPFPVSRTDATGDTLRYGYNGALQLVTLTNAKGEVHQFDVDAAGRVVRETGFDGRQIHYGWDAGNQMVERRDAAGATRFHLDDCGRVILTNFSDGQRHRFTWDAAGRMTSAVSPQRSVLMTYDAAGQLVGERQDGLALAHAYDHRGRRTGTQLPDGRAISVTYDAADRFSAVSLDGRPVATVQRDQAGHEIQRRAGVLEVTSEYDAAGFLLRQHGQRRGHAGAVIERRYTYNPYGQLVALNDLARGEKRYRYDDNARLVGVDGATPEAFVVDPAGNVLPAGPLGVQGVATGDRLRVWGDRRFEYDADGRRIRELRGAGEGRQLRYAYDGAGMLAEVVERSRRGLRVTRFGYDALGRRVWKDAAYAPPIAANAEPGAGPELNFDRTVFYWDGDLMLSEAPAEVGGAATDPLSILYLHEPDSFRPLALARRGAAGQAAEIHHFQLDAAGTPQELTNDNGVVTWRQDLAVWGAAARMAEAEIDNPIRFQGQYADVETGLHYNRFRYYDPDVARYVTPDPIGLWGGQNAFAYAPDPNSWVDPLGLACAFVDKNGTLNLKNKFPPGSPEDLALKQHVADWNQQITAAGGSMTRQAVTPAQRIAANKAALAAKVANPSAYPKGMVGGHTPDVGWGGQTAGPINPLMSNVNGYVGGATQAVAPGTVYNNVVLF
ncbi:RHS repeat-associated core domain-containing protein [Caulobacter segnis]